MLTDQQSKMIQVQKQILVRKVCYHQNIINELRAEAEFMGPSYGDPSYYAQVETDIEAEKKCLAQAMLMLEYDSRN